MIWTTLSLIGRLDCLLDYSTRCRRSNARDTVSHIDPTPDAPTFRAVHPRGVSFNALIDLAAA